MAIKLDSDQITQLIECGNKNLNKRLVFDNLEIVKKAKNSFLTKTGSVVLIAKILKRLFGGK